MSGHTTSPSCLQRVKQGVTDLPAHLRVAVDLIYDADVNRERELRSLCRQLSQCEWLGTGLCCVWRLHRQGTHMVGGGGPVLSQAGTMRGLPRRSRAPRASTSPATRARCVGCLTRCNEGDAGSRT